MPLPCATQRSQPRVPPLVSSTDDPLDRGKHLIQPYYLWNTLAVLSWFGLRRVVPGADVVIHTGGSTSFFYWLYNLVHLPPLQSFDTTTDPYSQAPDELTASGREASAE